MTPQPGSHFDKYNSSPAVVHSPAFLAIEAEAEPVEAALEAARSSLPSCLDHGYRAAYERVRLLRRQLSALDARSRAQFYADNPAWAEHWGVSS